MGRPRKDPSQGLPPGIHLKGGSFYTVIRNKWLRLGKDLQAAVKGAQELREGLPISGTMGHWFDAWKIELNKRVAAGTLATRTRDDYFENIVNLNAFFGAMAPADIRPSHVGDYLEVGRDEKRSVRANREKAALSSCMSWLIIKDQLVMNPCKEIKRNAETKRDRFITDDEYLDVRKHLGPAELLWSELIFRTLQRPSDILRWTTNNLVNEGGRTLIRFRQSKTGAQLSIVVSPQLQAALDAIKGVRTKPTLYLIPREDGRPYTETGIASMFRRAVVTAGIKDFAPYDLKAMGATGMRQAGTPIEQISLLCGHESIKTTEIYLKRRLRVDVEANNRELVSSKTTRTTRAK